MKNAKTSILLSILLIGFSFDFASAKEESVSTRKDPWKLALTLHSTKLKIGQPIWFRITLTNVGKRTVRFFDQMFCPDNKAFYETMENEGRGKRGFYLEASGPDGKPIEPEFPVRPSDILGGDIPKSSEPQPPIPTDEQIFEQKTRGCPNDDIKPGDSRETPAWVFKGFGFGRHPEFDRQNPPTPPGQFAELVQFHFEKPGRYRISATFNMTYVSALKQTDDLIKKYPGSFSKEKIEKERELSAAFDRIMQKSAPGVPRIKLTTPPIVIDIER